MRPEKNIERSIKNLDGDIEVNPKTDHDILTELTDAHRRATLTGTPALGGVPSRGRLGYVGLAAVVLIAVAVGLFGLRHPHRERGDVPQPPATMSAAEMLTVGQLKVAFQRGGLAAVEAQCEKAADKVDTPPEKVSIEDLIVELKGK
jgi:hypothetical protein